MAMLVMIVASALITTVICTLADRTAGNTNTNTNTNTNDTL